MEHFASEIFLQVNIILKAIDRLQTESPSFENGIPRALLADKQAAAARQRVLALTDDLHALLSDPEKLLATQTNPIISTNAISQLGLVATLPVGSPGRKIEDMAAEAGLPTSLAKRLMKHAAAHRIYRESSPGVFTHTAASKILASDPDCQKWLCSAVENVIAASYKIPKAVLKYGASGKPNQAAWNVEHDLPVSFFEGLGAAPARAENFAASMRFFSKHPRFDMRHLFAAFDWQSLAGKTLTDVGGSAGHASIYLAERVDGLRCIVQDRPEVIDQFRNSAPLHLANSVVYEPHDFFQDQVRQSDAFLLRLILHDWSEDYARQILNALIPGLKTGTKVLIQDVILPRYGDEVSHFHQKIMRGFDMNILGLQNGQERDIDDWENLTTKVDRRFNLTRVYQSPDSAFGLLEYTWASF